jgi:hypothetical protein
MLKDLSPAGSITLVAPGGLRNDPRGAAPTSPQTTGPRVAAPTGPERTAPSVEPSEALDRAVRLTARRMFAAAELDVTNFRDEATGRIVYRIADRSSGEVLVQSPPDELLRFWASARAALAEPGLVDVEV